MLHIVKSSAGLNAAAAMIAENDQLLLVEDAVYLANPKHAAYPQLKTFTVSVLAEDLAARGIPSRVSNQISVVDFSGFVRLTEAHSQSITWA